MTANEPKSPKKAAAKTAVKKAGDEAGTLEQNLWAAADRMRGHMDPSEYKHIALGLIFLKYISDAFDACRAKLQAEYPEEIDDKDSYLAEGVFWVPQDARWKHLKGHVLSPRIGHVINEAMFAIEKENPSLKGVLPVDYAKPTLDAGMLGKLIEDFSKIDMGGDIKERRDSLGRVYEYFLGRFAGAEGKSGGEFYTPQSVVKLLVEMLEPYQGRVYDPCCGSGGMFVQSERFVEAHGGECDDISIYGQESNFTTWKLCKMNMAIRGISCNLGAHRGDTFHNDLHKDLRADFILANPPFNISDWGGERLKDDRRWTHGVPPEGNANYAWIQHILHHLSPRGFAGIVLANGSMSSNTGGEGEIRRKLIESNVVDCMVALPGQLFYSTQIPVCLWFLAKDRSNGMVRHTKLRDRRGEILFIDARGLGHMVDRTRRELHDENDIAYIAAAYHAWRGEPVTHEAFADGYKDIPGFCKSASLAEVAEHGFVLTPGRYVGSAQVADDDMPFGEKMRALTKALAEQMSEAARLDEEIRKQLGRIGYGW